MTRSPICFIQAYLILLSFTLLHFTDVEFLQNQDNTLHQQDYDLIYCSGLELNLQCLQGMAVYNPGAPWPPTPHCKGGSCASNTQIWGLSACLRLGSSRRDPMQRIQVKVIC